MRALALRRAALVLIVSAAPLAALESSDVERRSFELPPTSDGRHVEIDNVFGPVTVRGGAGDRVEVTIHRRITADDAAALERARAEVRLEVVEAAGRLELVQDGPFRDDCDERGRRRGRHRERGYEVEWSWEVTVPSDVFVTQTAPSPTATPVGVPPTSTLATRLFDAGSMRPAELPAAASIASAPDPPCPKAKIGIATAAASTPIRPAASRLRRRSACDATSFSAVSGGNSLGKPSTSSWKTARWAGRPSPAAPAPANTRPASCATRVRPRPSPPSGGASAARESAPRSITSMKRSPPN